MLALLLALALASAPAHGPPQDPKRLVVEDYRFELVVEPDSEWELLDQERISSVIPGSLAGMVKLPEGFFGVVVAVRDEGGELQDFARYLMEGTYEEQIDEVFEKTEFRGLVAYRYVISGKVERTSFRYQGLVFERQGYLFQIGCWGERKAVDTEGAVFRPVLEAVRLLEGEIREPELFAGPADARGIGWSLSAGEYRGLASGLSASPPEGWRVVVWPELEEMSDDSEFGLIATGPEIYATVTWERRVPDREEYLASTFDDLSEDVVPLDEPPFEMSFGGRPIELRRFRLEVSGIPMHLDIGVLFLDVGALRVDLWYTASVEEAALPRAREALAACGFLDAEELARLRVEEASRPDSEEEIGTQHSLRGGVFRDFLHSYELSKPPGLWSFEPRADPEGQSPRLVAYEHELDINASLFVEVGGEARGEDYHRLVLEDWLEELPDSFEILELDEAEGRLTWIEDGDVDYAIATATVGDRGLLVISSVWSDLREQSEPRVRELLGRLRIGGDPVPREQATRSLYRDHRLGYELRWPEEGWRFVRIPMGSGDSASSGAAWEKRDGSSVFVLAAHSSDMSAPMVESILLRAVEVDFGERCGREPVASKAALGPLSGNHFVWKKGRYRLEAVIVTRGRTHYALCVFGRGSEPTLTQARDVFGFLP